MKGVLRPYNEMVLRAAIVVVFTVFIRLTKVHENISFSYDMLSMLLGLYLLLADHFESVLDARLLMSGSNDYPKCSRSYLYT